MLGILNDYKFVTLDRRLSKELREVFIQLTWKLKVSSSRLRRMADKCFLRISSRYSNGEPINIIRRFLRRPFETSGVNLIVGFKRSTLYLENLHSSPAARLLELGERDMRQLLVRAYSLTSSRVYMQDIGTGVVKPTSLHTDSTLPARLK